MLNNSELYKKYNININEEWLQTITNINNTTQNVENIEIDEINEKKTNESDEYDENKELPNAPSVNTLLTETNVDPHNKMLCIAPAEG